MPVTERRLAGQVARRGPGGEFPLPQPAGELLEQHAQGVVVVVVGVPVVVAAVDADQPERRHPARPGVAQEAAVAGLGPPQRVAPQPVQPDADRQAHPVGPRREDGDQPDPPPAGGGEDPVDGGDGVGRRGVARRVRDALGRRGRAVLVDEQPAEADGARDPGGSRGAEEELPSGRHGRAFSPRLGSAELGRRPRRATVRVGAGGGWERQPGTGEASGVTIRSVPA